MTDANESDMIIVTPREQRLDSLFVLPNRTGDKSQGDVATTKAYEAW
jgi:hypothetical protein